MLIENKKFNPNLPESATNQRFIFDQPTMINQQTGQMAPITGEALAPATPISYVSPNQIPVYPVSSIPQLELTQPEKESSDLIKQLQTLTSQTVGESAFRAEKEKEAGISELTKTQTDLAGQLKVLQAEAQTIPLQIQQEAIGRGITVGGIKPLETARLRENAIKALTTGALLQASQGQLTTALNLVDRAVEQQFGTIKEEIAAKTANLNLILKSPEFTIAEKNRAEQQKAIQETQIKAITKQEADAKEIYNISVNAAQQGADSATLQRLQSARSPQEALQIAGYYLGADFRAKLEQQKLTQDLQVATYNLSVDKFKEDTRQFNVEYALTQQKQAQDELLALQKANPVATAEATAEVLQDKIDLIDELINHPGLDSRVGVGWTTRGMFAIADRFGAGQSFAAGVTQLVNKETIDTLVNLKARGGTLGALSDQERILLQSAATKIGTWEIKKDGMGIGKYNIDEKSFKAELEKIKNLATKAKARALGGAISITQPSTEEDELRAMGYSDEQIRLLKEIK